MSSAISQYFQGQNLQQKTVLDAACGEVQPGGFILAQKGFGQVVAQDVFARHALIEKSALTNLHYLQGNLAEVKEGRFDCIVFISTLEHINPEVQPLVLQNLVDRLNPGGALLLTFDMPGYEYSTNLDLYKQILRDNNLQFREESVRDADKLTSKNKHIVFPEGFEDGHVKHEELSCYRLFAVRE